MKSSWAIAALAILMMTSVIACTDNRVYDQYVHTPINGWEKNDTLLFHLHRMAIAGKYASQLGLRINNDYPFMGVTLIVEQTVYPSHRHYVDTLNCKLIDVKGNSTGIGFSYHQYVFPITTFALNRADSIVVKVRHDMKREILPGISDIGYQLRRNQ